MPQPSACRSRAPRGTCIRFSATKCSESPAKQSEVEIRYDDRHFRMRVRDDGKGIDPKVLTQDGQAGHYGLHGMRERAKLVGGRLDVWSELDSGTEVELSIPGPIAYSRATDRSGSGRSGTKAE